MLVIPLFGQEQTEPTNCSILGHPLVSSYELGPKIDADWASREIDFFVKALRQCEEYVGYVIYTSGTGKARTRNLKHIAQLKKQLIEKYGVRSDRLIFVDQGKKGQEAINFHILDKSAAFPDQ